ncbi:MAG: hypothetical protein HY319_32225 [Armatimonadetes bacterium]|nr:hypothetical protein [Armatimonadota bacterium]
MIRSTSSALAESAAPGFRTSVPAPGSSGPQEVFTPSRAEANSRSREVVRAGMLAALSFAGVVGLVGCDAPAPDPQQVLDITGGDTGTGVALNDQGDFVMSGWRGTVSGRLEEGRARWDWVRGAEGRVLDLTGGDTGTGVALNERDQFIASGWRGTVAGRVGADGQVTWDWIRGADGQVLDLTGGDTGTGVSLNDHGQFVMSGWRGTVAGTLSEDGRVSWDWVRGADGKVLDITGGDTGTGVAVNNHGQFVISGWRGTVHGQIGSERTTWNWVRGADGGALDLTGGDTGTGVGLNDRGEFVISGWRGTVAGRLGSDGASWDWVRDARGRVLDLTGGGTGTGVSLNEQGEFVISGWGGTVAGRLQPGRGPSLAPVNGADGRILDVTGGDTATGVALNNEGQFVISGWRGTVQGRVDEDGTVHWDWVRQRDQR